MKRTSLLLLSILLLFSCQRVTIDNPEITLDKVLVQAGNPSAAMEALRRHKAGFILAQYGGVLVPAEGSLRPLAGALECPLLLVR